MSRVVLITGKGGAGKTTLAAATGLAAARRGARTLVLSWATPHGLADAFALDRGLLDHHRGQPWEVAERLAIEELETHEDVARHWPEIWTAIAPFCEPAGIAEGIARELLEMPGGEPLSVLLRLDRCLQEGAYDAVVVDCPASGEALRLAAAAAGLRGYLEQRQEAGRVLTDLAAAGERLGIPGLRHGRSAQVLEELLDRLQGVVEALFDPRRAGVRLVSPGGRMALRHTQRALLYFSLLGLPVEQLICNSEDGGGEAGSLARWRAQLSPLPVAALPRLPAEAVGAERLGELATALFGDRDPLAMAAAQEGDEIAAGPAESRLTLRLPFAAKDEVEITRQAGEVTIRAGAFRRRLLLPPTMAAQRTAGAHLEGGRLSIRFLAEEEP